MKIEDLNNNFIIFNYNIMDWIEFEKKLLTNDIYLIDNKVNKNIVLFGNCHMACIGHFLNKLLDFKFNIHIIISWIFDKNGLENFDMIKINSKINKIIFDSDIFIYQQHIKSYGINADSIEQYISKKTILFKMPNLRLDVKTLSKEHFQKSILILEYNINFSDFKEFLFILENYKNIIFFNNNEHPTHYLLYLLSLSLINKIQNNEKLINMFDYYDNSIRNNYKQIGLDVILPGRDLITNEIMEITGINIKSEYFD